ncbi:hypothetical protein [Micromonospora sp. WMMC415]|uniref:hypothetical protein n=1 Tax=Micromonospora sp. WMMC415 TaxID=2675222 RepID=UPI0018AF7990|nr:hypothetical protein [Micromonospora sp. WMMC415]
MTRRHAARRPRRRLRRRVRAAAGRPRPGGTGAGGPGLAQAWPDARLELLEAAGHGTGPGMADGVRAALDEFALDELARPR